MYWNFILSVGEYDLYLHKRSRKKVNIDEKKLQQQIDILPKSSYATYDDDNSVGDIVIIVREELEIEDKQDFNQIKSQLFPINADKIGISI